MRDPSLSVSASETMRVALSPKIFPSITTLIPETKGSLLTNGIVGRIRVNIFPSDPPRLGKYVCDVTHALTLNVQTCKIQFMISQDRLRYLVSLSGCSFSIAVVNLTD